MSGLPPTENYCGVSEDVLLKLAQDLLAAGQVVAPGVHVTMLPVPETSQAGSALHETEGQAREHIPRGPPAAVFPDAFRPKLTQFLLQQPRGTSKKRAMQVCVWPLPRHLCLAPTLSPF